MKAPSPRLNHSAEEMITLLTHAIGRSVHLERLLQRVEAKLPDALDLYWKKASQAPAGPIQVIDLFSGCGGMSAGFKAINGAFPAFNILCSFDIFAAANKTYERNIGHTTHADDIAALAKNYPLFAKRITDSGYRPELPTVLIGCAPCQGFSSHRNEAGSGDSRNTLFADFVKIATNLGPDVIVVENVPELLTDKYFHFARTARQQLERSGYFVYFHIYNMASFGVPQERFRAVILAMKRPFSPPQGELGHSEYKTVRDAIGWLDPVMPGATDARDPLHVSANHRPSTIDVIRQVPKDGGNRPSHVGPRCLIDGRARHGKAIYEDVYGRLSWGKPAITITGSARNPASGRFVHPEQDRGLTIREAALLQGFPRDYSFEGSLDDCFLQIGNAVPPLFASRLAIHIIRELTRRADPALKFDKGITESLGKSYSRIIPSLKNKARKVNSTKNALNRN